MTKPLPPPPWAKGSPWQNDAYSNVFRNEIGFVLDPLDVDGYRPSKLFQCIHDMDGVDLLYKALAHFAPMFPTYGFHEEVSHWTAPPPFMSSDVICVVMGCDSTGLLRVVGGNCFRKPKELGGRIHTDKDFFAQYDRADEAQKKKLVHQTVSLSICEGDKVPLRKIEFACALFNTMPIYLALLTEEGSLFGACPALVDGINRFDPSCEIFGEVK